MARPTFTFMILSEMAPRANRWWPERDRGMSRQEEERKIAYVSLTLKSRRNYQIPYDGKVKPKRRGAGEPPLLSFFILHHSPFLAELVTPPFPSDGIPRIRPPPPRHCRSSCRFGVPSSSTFSPFEFISLPVRPPPSLVSVLRTFHLLGFSRSIPPFFFNTLPPLISPRTTLNNPLPPRAPFFLCLPQPCPLPPSLPPPPNPDLFFPPAPNPRGDLYRPPLARSSPLFLSPPFGSGPSPDPPPYPMHLTLIRTHPPSLRRGPSLSGLTLVA